MHVHIDRERCTGHGRCYSLAPEIFDCDEEGFSVLRSEPTDARLEAAARRGADGCPERAISLTE